MLYAIIIAVIGIFIYLQSGTEHVSDRNQRSNRAPLPELREDFLAIPGVNDTHGCPEDTYKVHIYSKEPLVIYIENFLSPSERSELLETSAPLFQPSTITHDGTTTTHDPSVRLSSVALLPRTPTIRCIESRARSFQGWRRDVWIERLRTQLYGPSGHYGLHYDWSTKPADGVRVSSFMVWVDDGASTDEKVVGGGTEFPFLKKKELVSRDAKWCDFVECDGEWDEETQSSPSDAAKVPDADGRGGPGEGVTFKVKPGNAVFWENFRSDGSRRGYPETFHAGKEVIAGKKVGLNIWSWGAIE